MGSLYIYIYIYYVAVKFTSFANNILRVLTAAFRRRGHIFLISVSVYADYGPTNFVIRERASYTNLSCFY